MQAGLQTDWNMQTEVASELFKMPCLLLSTWIHPVPSKPHFITGQFQPNPYINLSYNYFSNSSFCVQIINQVFYYLYIYRTVSSKIIQSCFLKCTHNEIFIIFLLNTVIWKDNLSFFTELEMTLADKKTKGVTFLISLVSIQRSILSTVDISMCSLEMELSQAVKLSSVARKRTQVNFKILNILLMMLSKDKGKATEC